MTKVYMAPPLGASAINIGRRAYVSLDGRPVAIDAADAESALPAFAAAGWRLVAAHTPTLADPPAVAVAAQ